MTEALAFSHDHASNEPGSLPSTVEIAERRGCDATPIDASTPEGRLTLLTYIWPDQRERIARMEAALKVAADVPVSIDRETASTWTKRVLASTWATRSVTSPGSATTAPRSSCFDTELSNCHFTVSIL